MSTTAHPGERLAEFVDGRLDSLEAAAVREHLAACDACRAVHDDLVRAHQAAASLRGDVAMPADLLASVTRALAAEAESTRITTRVPDVVRASPRRWPLFAGVAAAALVLAFVLLGPREVALDLPAQAARDLAAVGSRTLPLDALVSDAAALERYFAASPGPRVRVIHLAMMNITLEGGVRHTLAGRQSALYSYRTPSGARLVCQMFEGRLADLPPASDTREQNGFRFQIYSRGAATLVFWQEGDLVCVLASELPAAEVVALAVAKAMAPA
jgi:anti-sigma factor RsiW